ncbi:MAG: hypothetical protein FJ304_13435, partial [Planctomycetes bacterium]|nr:hypothetical protein [Planctomycetota bacterium]
MSDPKSDIIKPARGRGRKADTPVEKPAAHEDDGFAAGIVEEPKPDPAPEVRESRRAERAEPRARVEPP